jgi:hypothetical protein
MRRALLRRAERSTRPTLAELGIVATTAVTMNQMHVLNSPTQPFLGHLVNSQAFLTGTASPGRQSVERPGQKHNMGDAGKSILLARTAKLIDGT